jgi:hypothetical protein
MNCAAQGGAPVTPQTTQPAGTAAQGTDNLATFDPRAPAFVADPYPFYARLRERAPVRLVPATNSWWITRYADARQVLQDKRFGKGWMGAMPGGQASQSVEALGGAPLPPSMLFQDPPDHTRLRALVNRAFTPRVVDALRPRIERIAGELLDRVIRQGHADLVADFAVPLPAIVIAELLGVPAADREQFKSWSTALALALDVTQPPEVRTQANDASRELTSYFATLLQERRRQPQADLLSDLLAVEEQGDRLSRGELLAMGNLLLVAGHETTTNLIASGMLALLQHPDQLTLLRQRPELLPSAVEEVLRYESPVQRVGRIALEPVVVGDTEIAAGQVVAAVVAAANRDQAVFADPDRLDVTRRGNQHLAFGHGIHFCLGAPLARTEGQIAFATLLQRLPDLELATTTPEWSGNTTIRSLRRLPVRF